MEDNNKTIEACFPFKRYRTHQKKILYDIVNSLKSGNDLIILEGPTGFGKSPVNIALRKYFKPTFYTTPQVKLVNQIAKDFCPKELAIDGGIGDTIALLGRKNYICRETDKASDICPIREGLEEVDKNGNVIKRSCPNEKKCTYWKQKEQALESDIAVLTFAMLIINTYLKGFSHFPKRNLLIIDECHSLESQVAGMFAGFIISPNVLPKLEPKEYREEMWEEIEETLPKTRIFEDYLPFFNNFETFSKKWRPYCEDERQRDKLVNLSRRITYMLREIDEGRKWVIDIPDYKKYSKKKIPRSFKPILVDLFLQRKVWSQANKIILSSATIPVRENNIDAWLKRVGLTEKKYSYHSVPMLFPLWNRQIITSCMGGKMTNTEESHNWEGNVNIIKEIIRKHNGERGVIHTQSYKRAEKLHNALKKEFNTFLHDKTKTNGDIIKNWINSDKMILISPAIKEGVDLKDDICRFQILLKIPYLNIKDARVDYLLNKKKEWKWYNSEAIKEIIQLYGRAIRSSTDYARLYIVDGSFKSLSRKGFPKWFLDAIID